SFWLNIGHQMINGELRFIGTDILHYMLKIGFKLKRIFYWYKRNYASGYHKRNLLLNYEPIYFFAKNPEKTYINEEYLKFNDFHPWIEEKDDIFPYWLLIRKGGSIKKSKKNPHPASYPDELVERVIQISSKEGDKVLDPFLGSGTTTKLAESLNRYGIGFEINSSFYTLIKCRMELDDDFSLIKEWTKKFNENRKLGHETQKMKNY
ncbi:MAG: DNA-methyltransferase, partial [Candidatus Hodarchaeota archaeon]